MNFLHVTASMDPSQGGLSQGLRNTIPELSKLNVHNEVVSLDEPGASYLGKDSFKIHAVGSKGPWAYSKQLIPWLTGNLHRFDVVIVHGLWLYHSYATNKALQRLNKSGKSIRLFIMPHGMLDPYFQEAKGRKLKAVRNYFYWKIIESKVVNQSDGLLFTCETELQLARKPFFPYRPKREINVGFGIETPPIHTASMRNAFNAKCPGAGDQPYLLFISRLHSKKGLDILVDAYKSLVDKKVRMPKLIIAGPGLDTSFGKMIFDMVNGSETLRELVLFPGMLTDDAKWGAFYGCEAFVLPSHQENFGIAVVEAMGCGKPVLISNKVNIWQEIEAAGGGIIADDTEPATAEMLAKWMSLPADEKQMMGLRAQEAYRKDFAISSAAKNLFEAVVKI